MGCPDCLDPVVWPPLKMEVENTISSIQTTWKLGGLIPENKAEQEDVMDSGQPTIISILVTRHRIKCWSESIQCFQPSGWHPGPIWVSILQKVVGLNWRLWITGNVPQCSQMIVNKAASFCLRSSMRFSVWVNSDKNNGGSYQSSHACVPSFDFQS